MGSLQEVYTGISADLKVVTVLPHLMEQAVTTLSSILTWKNPMDRGVWWATIHGVAKSQT